MSKFRIVKDDEQRYYIQFYKLPYFFGMLGNKWVTWTDDETGEAVWEKTEDWAIDRAKRIVAAQTKRKFEVEVVSVHD